MLAAEVGQEITGEEFDAIYNAGQKSFNDFSQKLEALHPAAKEARLKDIAEHPDRNVVPFEKKDGWNLYKCVALNKIDSSMDIEFVSPDFVSITAKSGEWQFIEPEEGTLWTSKHRG